MASYQVEDPARALELMPAAVDWALSVDLSESAERPKVLERLLASLVDGEAWSGAVAGFENCGYALGDLRRVSIGGWFDPTNTREGSAYVVVLERSARVSSASLACLDEARATDDMWSYLVDEERLVLGDGVPREAIEAVLVGIEPNAKQGRLAGPLAYADLGASLFWVGDLEGLMPAARADSNPIASAKSASLGVRFSSRGGLAIEGQAAMPSEASALGASEFLAQEFEEVKGMAGIFGFSRETVEAVDFASRGTLATLFVPLAAEDVERVLSTIDGGNTPSSSRSNN